MKTVIHGGCLFAQPAAQLRLVESEYHLCHDLRWISRRQPSIGDGIFHELTDTFDDRQTPLLEPGRLDTVGKECKFAQQGSA